jgi:hypothetical protein
MESRLIFGRSNIHHHKGCNRNLREKNFPELSGAPSWMVPSFPRATFFSYSSCVSNGIVSITYKTRTQEA